MLRLMILTHNAAFDGRRLELETARILRTAADKLEDGMSGDVLYDVNGNAVGAFSLIRDRRKRDD